MIIGFAGKKQVGKDTAALCIQNHYGSDIVEIFSFASPIKNLVTAAGFCDGFSQKSQKIWLRWQNLCDEVANGRTGQLSVRDILQIVGTDLFRDNFAHNIWTMCMGQSIKNSQAELILIPDVRFLNECQFIKSYQNSLIFKIQSDRVPNLDTHKSQVALDSYNKFDMIISNNDTIEKFADKITHIVQDIGIL